MQSVMSQLKEVSAKLKLKTHEFDILASSEKKTLTSESPHPPMSTCVKEEPVTMVNVIPDPHGIPSFATSQELKIHYQLIVQN